VKDIISDPNLVAYCGLYCGACREYLRDRCPGCHDNQTAPWCKIRSCCRENQFATCADCREFPNPNDCRKFNNWVAKVFGFIFRSDRPACIRQIRELGVAGHAEEMTRQKRHSIKR